MKAAKVCKTRALVVHKKKAHFMANVTLSKKTNIYICFSPTRIERMVNFLEQYYTMKSNNQKSHYLVTKSKVQ